jgi:hypothetical protein
VHVKVDCEIGKAAGPFDIVTKNRVGNKQASQAERPQLAGLQFLTP